MSAHINAKDRRGSKRMARVCFSFFFFYKIINSLLDIIILVFVVVFRAVVVIVAEFLALSILACFATKNVPSFILAATTLLPSTFNSCNYRSIFCLEDFGLETRKRTYENISEIPHVHDTRIYRQPNSTKYLIVDILKEPPFFLRANVRACFVVVVYVYVYSNH